MNLLVLSHKEIWADPASPSGYATVGGFPYQMAAISELFDQTTIIAALRETTLLNGTSSLTGHNVTVSPLPEPSGQDLRRKLALLTWLPQNLKKIWCSVRQADAVHTPVPGDIGTIGILVALAQRKPLFVRHCGTWGNQTTLADRFLDWLLPRIAGGRNVVLATGGGDTPPSKETPNIHWIFSTSLTDTELASLPVASPWTPGETLRLVTVGRLTEGKNISATIWALSLIIDTLLPATKGNETRKIPSIRLDIAGDGSARPSLEALAAELGVANQVTFHGNVAHENVLHILSASHIFVFPTRVKEGFPKAVLEALACGLPVIGTNVSVIPNLIEDSGYMLPETSPEAVAQAVEHLLEDPCRLQIMSQNARRTVQKYTLERWRDEIGAHLQATWGSLRFSEPSQQIHDNSCNSP